MTDTYLIQAFRRKTRTLPVVFSAFPDGDTHCVIAEPQLLQSAPVLIVHHLYPNQNEQLLRLMLLIDLLHDLGIADVSVFCPYLPYSRQDKRHVPGEALGMHTINRMLAAAGCTRLYVIDCHFMRGVDHGVYDGLPIINISAIESLFAVCRTAYLHTRPFQVVGPDKGASLLANGVADQYMHKTRGTYTGGTISMREITNLAVSHISLKYDTVVVVDDMISTGTTMLRAVELLRAKGARYIYCVCTHALFLGDSFTKLTRVTDGIVAGDTISHAAVRPIVDRLLGEKILPHWSRPGSITASPEIKGRNLRQR